MEEVILKKTIEVFQGANYKEDFNIEKLTEEDKEYFGFILSNLENKKLKFLNSSVQNSDIIKGITLNLGVHTVFHEHLEKKQDPLEDEFSKVTSLFILESSQNLKKALEEKEINPESFLKKLAYGFLGIVLISSDLRHERAKIERSITYQLYYESIIKKSLWGIEVDVKGFYEALKTYNSFSIKKIKKLLNDGGYFVLENI